jgi:hypothetical protein
MPYKGKERLIIYKESMMSCNNLDVEVNNCALKMKNMLNAAVMSTVLKSLDLEQDGSFNRMCPLAGGDSIKFIKCPWKDKDSMEKGL